MAIADLVTWGFGQGHPTLIPTFGFGAAVPAPTGGDSGGGGALDVSPDTNLRWQRFGADALLPYDEWLRRKRKREQEGLTPLPPVPIAVPLEDIQPNVEPAPKKIPEFRKTGNSRNRLRRQEAEDYVLLFSRPETLTQDLIDAGEMGLEEFILLRGGDLTDTELFRRK